LTKRLHVAACMYVLFRSLDTRSRTSVKRNLDHHLRDHFPHKKPAAGLAANKESLYYLRLGSKDRPAGRPNSVIRCCSQDNRPYLTMIILGLVYLPTYTRSLPESRWTDRQAGRQAGGRPGEGNRLGRLVQINSYEVMVIATVVLQAECE